MKLSFLRHLVPQSVLDRRIERQMNRYFREKIREARAAKDSAAVESLESQWVSELWDVERDQRFRAQRRLFRKALRLYVPLPTLTDENSVEGVLMDDGVLSNLVSQIRKAQKERQDLFLPAIAVTAGVIGALAGLLGTVIALVSIFRK